MEIEKFLNLIESEFFIVIRDCTSRMNYLAHCDYYIFENVRFEVSTSTPLYLTIFEEDFQNSIVLNECLRFEDLSHENCISVYECSKFLADFTQYQQFKNELDVHIRKHKLKRMLC